MLPRVALATLALTVAFAGCSGLALSPAPVGPSLPQALLGPASTSIVVEVSAVHGQEPSPGTLAAMRDVLSQVTGKPVTLAGPADLLPAGGDYRERDLVRIHRETSFFAPESGFLDGPRVVLHVLYLDGAMAGDDPERATLGRSLIDRGIVAIFRDSYANAHRLVNGSWSWAASEIDRYVLLHEVGHALGLVGNGVPMQRDHDAPGHVGHSRYTDSVMYYHPPMTPDGLVTGPVAQGYDVDDLADLAAYRAVLHSVRRPD